MATDDAKLLEKDNSVKYSKIHLYCKEYYKKLEDDDYIIYNSNSGCITSLVELEALGFEFDTESDLNKEILSNYAEERKTTKDFYDLTTSINLIESDVFG